MSLESKIDGHQSQTLRSCARLQTYTRRALFHHILTASVAVSLSPVLVVTGQAEEKEFTEYQVKATLLLKLLRFTRWPSSALPPKKGASCYIGVLGDDPFDGALQEAARGKDIEGHPVRLRNASHIDELLDCAVVFICASESEKISEIRKAIDQRPILTFGNGYAYGKQGVMINFIVKDKRIHFEVNYGSVRNASLELDAQLLKLATLVETEKPHSDETVETRPTTTTE